MANFALEATDPAGEIISSINYLLANQGTTAFLTSGNVLTANITTGEITTTSTNSGGYTDTTVVSYLYQYMNVKYANSSTGGSGFTSNSTLANYYGLRNTSNVTVSNNPTDYVWSQVTGGFGTTKNLWYSTIGGRQVEFFPSNVAPAANWDAVPDMPLSTSAPIDLDVITAAQANQIVTVNAYYQANTTPATPAGGFYNFSTLTLTPPATWSDVIPTAVANTSVYVSATVFTGNSTANVAPARPWSTPVEYITTFSGNTGAPGERGFVPLGFVLTSTDPTTYTTTDYTNAFGASRQNVVPPIGLGFAPIANDTAQFFFANLLNRANDVTVVKQFDGNAWVSVDGQVVSGNIIYPGSITANALSVNSIYAITIQSTNATLGNVASAGYWLQANTGDARFGGQVSIGNNLTVGTNANIGGNLTIGANIIIGNFGSMGTNFNISSNLTVGANAAIGNNLIVGNNASVGTNLSVGANAAIGNNLTIGNNATIGNDLSLGANLTVGDNLTVGNNASIGSNLSIGINSTIGGNLSIGDNLTVANLITAGALNANTVTTNQLVVNSATQTITVADNTNYPIINFINGNIVIGGDGYIWPPYRRGFAIGGGATITTTTDGSATGSKILINYNAYINSLVNVNSGIVELWKSGSSSFYQRVFRGVRSYVIESGIPGSNPNYDHFYTVGDNGSMTLSNIGSAVNQISTITTGTNNNLFDIFPGIGGPGTLENVDAIGQSGVYVRYSPPNSFTSNIGNAVARSGGIGTTTPFFNMYGAVEYTGLGLSGVDPKVFVGEGGQITVWSKYINGLYAYENSGVFADLNDVATDLSTNTAVTFGTTVNYVAVGTGGTILYNSRTYNSTGNVATTTGWTAASSGTIESLNSVASNWTISLRGNLWVAVGNDGTVVSSPSGSGPWTAANSVPVTTNLNSVAYVNGYWIAVGDAGTIISSTDGTNWTGPIANPADGSIPSIAARNLYGVAGGYWSNKFVAAGEEIILTANTTNPVSGGWNSNIYLGGSSLDSSLTRLQYFGSSANVANVATVPTNQQVTNGQIISGTYTDINYVNGETITYYLVLGNMVANTTVYTNGPNMTVTEFKR